jgi:hypothetical protein
MFYGRVRMRIEDEAIEDKISELKVCQSVAGYYIGRMVTMVEFIVGKKFRWDEPYSRNSVEYWHTEEEAAEALRTGRFTYREF